MLETTPSVAGSMTPLRAAVAVLGLGVVAVGGYALHEHTVARQQTEQNAAVTSALNTTQDQVNALTSRLDAMKAEQAARKAAETHPPVYRKPLNAASSRHRVDDPRWKKMQGQLDDQAKQIDSNRQDLASARTELAGSIATTHDELMLLEKKGERSYYEFDLDKSKQFQHEGPVGVRVQKANTKHEYADLELLVDDFKLSKKHVNIYEPVVMYSGDRKVPVELVINAISKNHIHGYVSEPKYKEDELQATTNSPANGADAAGSQPDPNAKPSPARQRLEVPKQN